MARAGRKRKLHQVREPNGRLSRALESQLEACSPGEVKRLRDAALCGMRSEEWGTELGRLFLNGDLRPELFETGKRWARLAAKYRAAINAPRPDAVASSFEYAGKTMMPDPDSDEGREVVARDRAVVKQMNDALAVFQEAHAVLMGGGMLAEREVRAVCERNESPVGVQGLESLKTGLLWVAKHWGLVESTGGR